MSFRPISWAVVAAGLIGLAAFPLSAAQADVPKVVTSIKPIDSLVAGVMGDLGTPRLLVQGGASPHSYALKPSDAQALDEADIVFRVSENLETFLNHPLETLSGKAEVVDLAEAEGVQTLAFRKGAIWEEDEHHHHDDGDDHAEKAGGEAEHNHHDHSGTDPHVWLDPANARAMVNEIAKVLTAADPDHADTYSANAAQLNGRLMRLQEKIADELAPVQGRPFIVFHDGYHYFEHRFGVEAAGAVAVDPERQPGAARVREIRDRITKSGAICIFTEPQFRPQLVTTLIDGTSARAGVLDPLGADVKPGPGAYETMMGNLAANLHDCLAGS